MSEPSPLGGGEGYGACDDAQMQTFVTGGPVAFAANQRDEVRDLHDLAGAVTAQPGMKQQTFIAENCLTPWDTQQARISTPEGTSPTLTGADGGGGRNPGGLLFAAAFSAGAGAKAGGISYSEDCAPTLKASPRGNLMPSVLCLNDQGGGIMDCSEDLTGTLRAQEHGHQPLLYENHGVDARYTGPHEVAPTMTSRYGSGGNNVPLVAQEESLILDNKQFPPQEGHKTSYTIAEYLAVMAPVFQRQQAVVDRCIAGLTVYAAGLAANGHKAEVLELGQFIWGMAEFWDPDTSDQHSEAYERAVASARDSGEAPELTEQGKADILAGLALHARELRVTDSELEEWAAECDSFAKALEGQWQAEAAPPRQSSSPQQDTTQINMELGGM